MKPHRSTPHLFALKPLHSTHWASIAARCAFAAGAAVLAFAAIANASDTLASDSTPASAASPAAASTPAEERIQIETRLRELNRQLDAHADLLPLKQAADEADKKLKAANKEAGARLDPEGAIDALRKEARTASPERQAEIKARVKQHEMAVAADPAVAPLLASREAARKAYAERRKELAPTVAPELVALEKRRNELRYPKK
jgi:hypothetical protein